MLFGKPQEPKKPKEPKKAKEKKVKEPKPPREKKGLSLRFGRKNKESAPVQARKTPSAATPWKYAALALPLLSFVLMFAGYQLGYSGDHLLNVLLEQRFAVDETEVLTTSVSIVRLLPMFVVFFVAMYVCLGLPMLVRKLHKGRYDKPVMLLLFSILLYFAASALNVFLASLLTILLGMFGAVPPIAVGDISMLATNAPLYLAMPLANPLAFLSQLVYMAAVGLILGMPEPREKASESAVPQPSSMPQGAPGFAAGPPPVVPPPASSTPTPPPSAAQPVQPPSPMPAASAAVPPPLSPQAEDAARIPKIAQELAALVADSANDNRFLDLATRKYGEGAQTIFADYKAFQLFAIDLTLYRILGSSGERGTVMGATSGELDKRYGNPEIVRALFAQMRDYSPAAESLITLGNLDDLPIILADMFSQAIRSSGIDPTASPYSLDPELQHLLFLEYVKISRTTVNAVKELKGIPVPDYER